MTADTLIFSVLNLLTIWCVWDLKQEMRKQTAQLMKQTELLLSIYNKGRYL